MAKKTDEKTASNKKLFWVGIGASAGGLEALRGFVAELPKKSNITYIIVQHLSPTHKSMLAELIGRETHLKVKEIEDGEKPRADVIYITPSAHEVYIKEERLFLKLSGSDVGPKPSVNNFFYSMANEVKEQAIGIILSGTGSDGSNGIRAIRAAGGITMAQDEDSAKYFTMPGSAIETGCIDLVLTPQKMAKKLLSLIDAPRNKIPLEKGHAESNKFEALCLALKRYSGVDFREYKSSTLHRRIERRMTARSIFDFPQYVDFVLENPDELETLFKDILISVTSFFRDKDCFQSLAKEIDNIVQNKGNQTIRIWVPGCATGEEVYSIAILFAEAMGLKIFENSRLVIFATDIDAQALEIARKGVYPLDLSEHIPPKMLERYFDLTNGSSYIVKKEIKNKIVFSNHNLLASPPFSRIDLISCRNLLIYFNNNLQRKVLEIFHYSLMTGGVLFLGKSETLGDMEDYYRIIESKTRLYKKKMLPAGAITHYRTLLTPKHHGVTRSNEPLKLETKSSDLAENVINAMAPNSILVDEKMNIRFIYGDIKPFTDFTPGSANMNIMNVLNQDLKHDVRALVYKCINQNISVTYVPKRIKIDNADRRVRLSIYPLFVRSEFEKLFLVNFELLEYDDSDKSDADKAYDSRITELEDELSTTKEYLQTVIEELETSNEELQASNEELQSVNEELQSSNEELETSNEELQSTNEELTTVNEEIQVRSSELTELNNHLNMLKDNVDVPLVVVDNSLRITLINKAAGNIFSDAGQLANQVITYIPTSITINNLQKNIEEVIRSGKPYSEQLRSETMAYYMKVTPLKGSKGETEGAVLVFVDNSELAQSRKDLRETEQLYALVVRATRDGIWDWPDIEKDDEYWSETWYKLLGYKPGEIKASAATFFKMLHPDDREFTQKAAEKAIKGEAPFDVEYRLKTKSGDYKWFRAKGIVSENEETKTKRMTGSITDIDSQKKVQAALENSEIGRRAFIESSYDGYWDWHIKENYEYMSPRFWEMFGYDPATKRHDPSEWHDIINQDDLKMALSNFDKHVKTKGKHPYSQEVRYRNKDGSTTTVLCRGSVVEWDPKDGSAIRMIGTHTDITGIKATEATLKKYTDGDVCAKHKNCKDFISKESANAKAPDKTKKK